jgi:endonuclease YncB( thermonuclease family)
MKSKLCQATVSAAVLMLFTGLSVATASTVISRVVDGDTITLGSGEMVRLLQIDTPELDSSECYGVEARAILISLLNARAAITLRGDPNLDKVDRYGRSLRYIFVGNTNINLKMVELGAAVPYFYRGERGLYSSQLLKAAKKAKKEKRGLWKACPGTLLTPSRAVTTNAAPVDILKVEALNNGTCDPNYSGCIPISSLDLNCGEIKRLGMAPVRVIGIDVHRLDRNKDGIGCEK